jgi:hypothetical protein
MHAVKSGIVVLFGDTDGFILLMHYWNIFLSGDLKELWIRACVGDSKSYIPVHILALRIGKELVFATTSTYLDWLRLYKQNGDKAYSLKC